VVLLLILGQVREQVGGELLRKGLMDVADLHVNKFPLKELRDETNLLKRNEFFLELSKRLSSLEALLHDSVIGGDQNSFHFDHEVVGIF
jgi:hypothetical protein